MTSLGAEQLLNVWEQGLNQPLLQRALMLLVAAFPDRSPDGFATLSIGERDLLLQLRERLFGQHLSNTAICPQCNERLEWQSRIADFVIKADRNVAKADELSCKRRVTSCGFACPIASISPPSPTPGALKTPLNSYCCAAFLGLDRAA